MADDGFVTAVDANGHKHRVPKHYLDNPRMGYKLPPSARAQEPAVLATTQITEPAVLAAGPARPANAKETAK